MSSFSLCKIDDHGLLIVKGPDAAKFLQGQLTCDIRQIENQLLSTLGAHCTHRGRMLFSFRLCQLDNETFALNLYNDLIGQAKTSLEKYSIFSKADIIDASEQYAILGADKAVLNETLNIQSLPETPHKLIRHEFGTIICIDDQHYEIWASLSQYQKLQEKISVQTAKDNDWRYVNIAAGIGEVRPETVETFVPQMLNLQAVGTGVSFKKGCYTGQEIVARTHYLGKTKKYMQHLRTDAPLKSLQIGEALYSKANNQRCGTIVLSAHQKKHSHILAVINNDAIDADSIYTDKDFTHKLTIIELPYAIPNE